MADTVIESPEQRALSMLNQGPKTFTLTHDAANIANAILIGALITARAIRGVSDPTLGKTDV